MEKFLPVDLQVMKGVREASESLSGLLGIAQVFRDQQAFVKNFANPLEDLTRDLGSMTAVFGISKVFRDHQELMKSLQSPFADLSPALNEISKQYTSLSQTLTEALKGYQAWDLGIANQLKAMELANHFTSITLPQGFLESLQLDAEDLKLKNEEILDDGIADKLNSLNVTPDGRNASEILDVVLEIINTIRIRVATLITSSVATGNIDLVVYDRIINHIGLILSIIMAVVQFRDQADTDEKIAQLNSNDERIERKLDMLSDSGGRVENKVADIENELEKLMNSIANPDLRVCTNSTPLKSSPDTAAVTICLVREYQIVSVVALPKERRKKKWIYITYIENGTGISRCSWALQKYFKKSKMPRPH